MEHNVKRYLFFPVLPFAEYVIPMCERIPGIPRVYSLHMQKSLGMTLTTQSRKSSCINLLLYPSHDQVSYAQSLFQCICKYAEPLPATLGCVHLFTLVYKLHVCVSGITVFLQPLIQSTIDQLLPINPHPLT